MSEILFRPMPQTEAEYESAVEQLFAEMQRLNEQIHCDQADIDRLKAESEHLKIEGQRLDVEARTRLNCLYLELDQLGGTR